MTITYQVANSVLVNDITRIFPGTCGAPFCNYRVIRKFKLSANGRLRIASTIDKPRQKTFAVASELCHSFIFDEIQCALVRLSSEYTAQLEHQQIPISPWFPDIVFVRMSHGLPNGF
jgi:hypothetical protein